MPTETSDRLTAERLRGIWAGVTMCWDEADRFDERTYAQNIQRTIGAGVHGIYTTGSTGEFYALDFGEFCRMVDVQADLCMEARMPLQIGCCSAASRETIRMLHYASGKKAVGAAQIVLPFWMELTEREMVQFFKDLHVACPNLPLVHYNIPRAKRFLSGPDYRRILDVCPSLIGVKFTFAGQYFGALQEALRVTPELSYFVGENLLASAMQLGARGCYSSLIFTNPKVMLDFYAAAEAGNWDRAIATQQYLSRFFTEFEAFVDSLGEGQIDPVGDKGLAVASGFAVGSARCRAPYIGWSDTTVVTVREWLGKHFPEFLYSPKA